MRWAWRAELVKIRTVKGQWITAVLASLAIPIVSLLVVATGRLGAGDTATSAAATGSVVGLLAFGTWAATIAAGEYATQTIITSLATTPCRRDLYVAKVTTIIAVAGVGSVLSALAGLLLVFAVEPPGRHPLGNPADLVGVVLAAMAVAAVGASIGILTRSVSASVAITAAAVLAPRAAGGLLGGVQRWVVGASPGTVVTQLVGGAQLTHDQTYPGGAWLAAVTMIAVAAAIAALGALAFHRRDG